MKIDSGELTTNESVFRIRFTVFTPTFNRAHLLHRVFESLAAQTFRDFEWLIVDDGSTDQTAGLVKEWQQKSSFPIRYLWQENGHKKTAFNRGVAEARGELFLCADSDDRFVPEALERFAWHWDNIPVEIRSSFGSITALSMDESGNTIGRRFPGGHYFDSEYLELLHKYRLNYERWILFRTDVLRRFPFPANITGHVPEGIVWARIGREYKTRCINEPLRIYYSGDDQLTRNRATNRNFPGLFLLSDHILEKEISWFSYNPLYFLRAALNWTRFGLQAGQIAWSNLKQKKFLVVLLILTTSLLGIGLFWKDRLASKNILPEKS